MKKCCIEGCEKQAKAKGMCKKHYEKERRRVKRGVTRTKYDSNEIKIHNDYAEVILYDNKCNIIGSTLIDIEDVEKVKNIKWCIMSKGYVIGTMQNKRILLHRFLMNCPSDMTVDHINRNKLDNRKSNLRICTMQENDFNKPILKNNTSNVTGVNFSEKMGKWRAYININRKQINLGWFANKEDAIRVRKQAEIEYFGEFRNK